MDIVGRLFGGTVRDRKLKNLTLDENEKIEKMKKEKKGGQKSMKIFPTPKEYRRQAGAELCQAQIKLLARAAKLFCIKT